MQVNLYLTPCSIAGVLPRPRRLLRVGSWHLLHQLLGLGPHQTCGPVGRHIPGQGDIIHQEGQQECAGQ